MTCWPRGQLRPPPRGDLGSVGKQLVPATLDIDSFKAKHFSAGAPFWPCRDVEDSTLGEDPAPVPSASGQVTMKSPTRLMKDEDVAAQEP